MNEDTKKLSKKDTEVKASLQKNDYESEEYKWRIGWRGEKYAYDILVKKYGIDNVIWHNKESESIHDDKGGIDIEICNKERDITHKIEVKTTTKSSKNNDNNKLAFYMSSEQYKAAQSWSRDTHLIFVTGIEDDKPEFLYMNFDNKWLNL